MLLLAYQLHPDVLKRGAAPILFDELRSLLEMGPVFSRNSASQAQDGAAPEMSTASLGPTVLGISDAVIAMHSSIDWARWRRNPAGVVHDRLHASEIALPYAPVALDMYCKPAEKILLEMLQSGLAGLHALCPER